jgi:hypothetical protein
MTPRRIVFSLAALIAGSLGLLEAQAPRPRVSPTQPVQGVAPRPVPSAPPAMMLASVDPALLKGLKYRLVGPSRGGRVTTVTGVPSQPRTFYMGVASGGAFRTTNGGANWVPITDGKVPLGSTGSIAVADSDPKIIYLGTGSDGVRSNVSTGRGVYKTVDGGETWQFTGLYNAGQIGGVRIHPTNPDIAWVAAYGDAFKANAERGVFKTSDGGKTWRKILYLSDTVGAMDVELQPGNPNVVYAWMNRVTWDVRHSSGLSAPPGAYQARLKVGDVTETQPFTVLIDPRVAAEGVTVADLKEQFDHNMRMRDLTAAASQLLGRVRAGLTGPKADEVREIYLQLVNTPEGVRYNKPGLQAHIQYLSGMTTGTDQKIGRDATARYQELKTQLDALKTAADRLLAGG